MFTRCKFVCTQVIKQKHWDKTKDMIYAAKFQIVTSGSPENQEYFSATPTGILELGVSDKDLFVPGQEYYLDITAAA